MSQKETFYVTTPIYYVNDQPHIGHAYTTVAADTIARYKNMIGYNTYFLTGTDEHGQKMEESAKKQNLTPIELADRNNIRFKELWKKLNIANNDFIRTTEERHKKAVLEMFNIMEQKGDIYLGEYEGWYCTPCESYWTETQILEGYKCPDCNRETSKLKESSYFFRLSKYGDKILKHIEDNPEFIKPESRRNEIISFLKEGLRDLSISRVNFSWGIPVVKDPKHVIYVWIDALTNYLSAIGYFDKSEKSKYWPADYHIIGKDILRFHTVYWPAMLMSAGIKLPKSVFAHGWWTIDGDKMSKSKGNAVDPYKIVDEFGCDAFRYFLLKEVPFGLDGDFSYKALILRINSDLANDLGNLTSRTIGMVKKYFNNVIPEYKIEEQIDIEAYNITEKSIKEMDNHLNNLSFSKALYSIWEIISEMNKYIDETKPWAVAKDKANIERLGSTLYLVLDNIRVLTHLIYPFMPKTALEIRRQLAIESSVNISCFNELLLFKKLKSGIELNGGNNIFPRIDEKLFLEAKEKEKMKEQFEAIDSNLIDFSQFEQVELTAGKIIEAENVKKSEKLLKFLIDTGSKKRTILSGIAKSYSPEDLINKTVAVVTNLKPVKLMGIESQGMVLAAFDGIRHHVLILPESIPAGTRIK